MSRYELDQLGFYQFEWLVQVLVKNEFGTAVEAWGAHADHGRDAYSRQDIRSATKRTQYTGPVIFQAKFVSGANGAEAKSHQSLLAACKQEAKRITDRKTTGKWIGLGSYFLYTNAPVTVATRKAIIDVLEPVLGIEPVILGYPDICAELDLNPQIAKSFPQILTFQNLLLGIDKSITDALNGDILRRTEAVLKKAKEVLSVFVPTAAFDQTWEVLGRHHFAVLSGPPEMGKTSISWMVALAHLAKGWQVVDCEKPEDFFGLHQSGKFQIFLADDAFGRTEYDPDIGRQWGRQLPTVLPQLDKNHLLIWTSRRHILERAKSEMDIGSTVSFPMPAEVIVNADSLTPKEKALILYRHAVAANLEVEAKSLLKGHVKQIVEDRHFTPLRIYLFCRNVIPNMAREYSAGVLSDRSIPRAIAKAIREVTSEMTKTYKALSLETKWLLMTLLDDGNARTIRDVEKRYELLSPVPLKRPISEMLDELDESFVRLRRS